MITIRPTHSTERVANIMFSEGLKDVLLGDNPNATVENFRLDPTTTYLLARNDDEIVGLFRMHAVNQILLETHINVLKKFWGTDIGFQIGKEFVHKIKTCTQFKKLLTHVPESCTQVIKYLERFGFQKCGEIKEGTTYRGTLQTLYYFTLEV